MRKPAVALLVSMVAVTLLAVPSAAKLEKAEMTSTAVIEDAYNRGDISHAEMMLQKAYAVYAPWKLGESFRGGAIDKCGAPLADELERELPNLPADIAEEIRELRARPIRQTYIETTHFRIHYDTSGTHMIRGWPNTSYRDAVMTAAENCWNEEVNVIGFRAPPPDGSDPDGGGGNNLYDIYVQNLGTGLYGYCQPTYYYSGPGYPANAATSYVVIDNDYVGFPYSDPTDPMKVTVAHEFCHAVQNAHDVNESTWYKEATSVWVEERTYDEINDYTQYLSSFLNSLYRSIDYHDGNVRWYGSCIWNFFLDTYFGGNIVRDNWYQMESSGQTLDMIDVVLGTYGSSIEEAYEEFAVWCWFTGTRHDGSHFEESNLWPTASVMRGHNSYPTVIGGPTPTWEPDSFGCNYITFNNPAGGDPALQVDYDGPSLLSTSNAVRFNYYQGGHYYEYGGMTLNPWGVGQITIDGWASMSFVGMVVINSDDASNDMNYTYTADEVSTGVEETYSLALRTASPNPFVESTSIAYSVPTGGGHVEVTVYDVNGREVRSLVSQRMDAGNGVAVWDGLDNRGEQVASGVYFARLDVDGLTASGKLIMLK